MKKVKEGRHITTVLIHDKHKKILQKLDKDNISLLFRRFIEQLEEKNEKRKQRSK